MKNLFYRKLNGMAGLKEKRTFKLKSIAGIALMLIAFFTISAFTNDASTGTMIAPLFGLAAIKRDPNQSGSTLTVEQEKQNLLTEIKGLISNKADVNTIKDLENVLNLYKDRTENAATKEEVETIKNALINIETIVKAIKEDGNKVVKGNDLREALEANKEALRALKAGGKREDMKGFTLTVNKAVGTMLESANISGGNVPVEQRIAGLNTIASRRIRLMDLFTKGTATSNLISWVYQSGKEGAAGGTAEGATKNQIDFDLVVASQVVCKRTAYIKISDEMIDDIDFINSEINNELMRELIKDIELTAYSGNGTAPALNGVRTVATAFAAGSFALAIDNANQVDVLSVAKNQILIADQPAPNAILMHPTDVTKLLVAKVSSTDKRYIERLQLIGGSLSMDGIPIIPTTLVTVDTYLIGSFDLATLYEKGQLSIEVGLDGNDFTKNLRTIRAEWRGALVVKNNDRTAFVKGTFSTDMAALETA